MIDIIKHETTIHVETRWRECADGARVLVKPDFSWFSCSCGVIGERIDNDRDDQPKALRAAHIHAATAAP